MMMEAKWMQPIVDANKIAFQTWFQSLSAMQDQTEKMMHTLWNQAPVVPESSKKMFNEWVDMFKKGRENMKKTVDQGFDTWEQFLAGTESKQDDKNEKAKSSTAKSASA
jgi:hypothetical protein